jgi:hypothetical protein
MTSYKYPRSENPDLGHPNLVFLSSTITTSFIQNNKFIPTKKLAWTGRSTLQPAGRPALQFHAPRSSMSNEFIQHKKCGFVRGWGILSFNKSILSFNKSILSFNTY